MDQLDDADRHLLRGKNFAHIATIDPDGAPQVTVTWIDVDSPGHVLVNSAVGRRKDRNIRRDPRVTVSIYEQDDPYRWLWVEGTVVSIESGPEAEAHIDALNQRYHDGERWTSTPGEQRVIYRIRPNRVRRSD
jgi:PPOX class probable F420-dependent enzyme